MTHFHHTTPHHSYNAQSSSVTTTSNNTASLLTFRPPLPRPTSIVSRPHYTYITTISTTTTMPLSRIISQQDHNHHHYNIPLPLVCHATTMLHSHDHCTTMTTTNSPSSPHCHAASTLPPTIAQHSSTSPSPPRCRIPKITITTTTASWTPPCLTTPTPRLHGLPLLVGSMIFQKFSWSPRYEEAQESFVSQHR